MAQTETTQERYMGFYFPKDVFANNIPFYEGCLANPIEALRIGVSEELAKKQLSFLKRFPPKVEHKRLSAHKIQVYLIKNPEWVKCGRLLALKGDLEEIFSSDLGKEISDICKSESETKETLGQVTIDLGDGTIVEGTQIKKSNYAGPANEKRVPNDYFDITFDFTNYPKSGEFWYSFAIKREAITLKQPKEYHIQTYVLVDGESVMEKLKIARPLFTTRNEKTPLKFGHLVFTQK